MVKKLKYQIQNNEDPMILMTCIQCYGSLSKAIKHNSNEETLHDHLYFLIESS